jgi:homopolymeric O-antigen transport system ATP-binding protein
LLKILSRITEPTEGQARLRGRVGSLLEIGTGFHPELTGRENIMLNGAILGMAQSDIRRRFEEIVAFADLEKFLDTPVKRYSSGMYVRLAFAVAAHLEPEILIVDEVLAVGDVSFQRKCLDKMSSVAKEGRTVLFVSHNLSAIRSLCNRGLLLAEGQLSFSGDVEGCIRRYEHARRDVGSGIWSRPDKLPIRSLGFARIAVRLKGSQPMLSLEIICSFSGDLTHRPALVAFDICGEFGIPLMQALPAVEPFINRATSKDTFRFDIQLPALIPGHYWLTAWVGPHYSETFDLCRDCVSFTIDESPTPGRIFPHSPDHGFIAPECNFSRVVADEERLVGS